jgi:ribulose-phosphate 3-epimerase
MKKIAVSIHATDNFDPSIINRLNGLDFIHVDVMDGKFVKTKKDNISIFEILKSNVSIPILAHLMVINPIDYISKIIENVDGILFHFESEGDKYYIISEVKKKNRKIGMVINPNTNISNVLPFLEKLDFVLVMSVYPGRSGQKFISETIIKVNKLAPYKKKYNFQVDVDGGINLENAKLLENADILSSASSIFRSNDPNEIIKLLKQI